MPDIAAVLDAQHEVYTENVDHWRQEERRLHGGYPMLDELEQFTNETDLSYKSRRQQSPLLNFGRIHAGIIVGHLNEVAPLPNYGTLGQVRERKAIPRGSETPAERFHYNANGVGTNGLTFTALSSGIQMRSLATGYRVTMVEMPTRPDGKPEDAPITGPDIRNGHRPFIVEYSPTSMPIWEVQDGRWNFAVLRTRWRADGLWTPDAAGDGYYLLVRQGYAGLGDEYAKGGWWLFDPQKQSTANGRWTRTRGEIPLALYMADESPGTEDHPSVASMPLMELNQLASGLMNRISERNWNARQAAKSLKHILGADVRSVNEASEMTIAGGMYIPWQPFVGPDNASVVIPQIYDGANGAVESSVYAEIIRSTIEEAHEIMVRQMTSTPDSTGRSKEAGFNEATSPMLSGLATRRESWENTIIPWVEMRSGAEQPSGFVQWPTEFDLTPIAQKIDRWYDTALKIGARSPIVEAIGAEQLAMESGIWPPKEADAKLAREELQRSIAGSIAGAQSEALQRMTASGATLEGSADVLGYPPADIADMAGGSVDGSPDGTLPEAQIVSGAEGSEATAGVDGGDSVTRNREPLATAGPPSTSQPAPPKVRRVERPPLFVEPGDDEPVPAWEPSPQPAAVDLSPVTDKIDALTLQIQALIATLASLQQSAPAPQPPAPVIVPIMMPQQAIGKTVSVTTPDNRTFSVNVEPTAPAENGTQPPTVTAPND